MAKIGRTLSYINTSPKPERNNGQTEQNQVSGSSRPGNGGSSSIPGNLQDYLLKSIWDRVWEIKTDSQGNEYIFGKLPVVTQYGITMYADGGELNLPSIYAGIPFDNKTIWLNPETKKVEVIGGTGGEGGGGLTEVYWDDVKLKPTFALVATSGKYADLSGLPDLSVYITTEYLTTELKKYVTVKTEQPIEAHKDFLDGLSIGGLPITKPQDDVIYLDANLVVRGGITMYAEGSVDVPTIMDALLYDDSTLGINSKGELYVKVGTGGGLTEVHWDDVKGRPTLLSSFINDVGYLTNKGGTIIGSFNIYDPTNTTGYGFIEIGKKDVAYYASVDNYAPNGGRGAGLSAYSGSTELGRIGIQGDGTPYYQMGNNSEAYVLLHSGNWSQYVTAGDGGNYLPLSGGTLTGNLTIQSDATYIAYKNSAGTYIGDIGFDLGGKPCVWQSHSGWIPIITAYWTRFDRFATPSTSINTSTCSAILGTSKAGMSGYNSGLGFSALSGYGRVNSPYAEGPYVNHLHGWIGLSSCINNAEAELYDLVFATNSSSKTNSSPTERMRITHDGSIKIQNLFFGNSNEINSMNGAFLCLNYEGTGPILMSNNGQGVVVAANWSEISGIIQQRLRQCMFSVRGGIFSYMESVRTNAAAYVFDKPGQHFTGIGSNGEADTIYFGAVDTSNCYSWVSYSQIWKFGGSIITTGGITMYSDIRKKTKLQDVELTLQQIADAPLIEHYYNSDQNKTTHVGSIAQYWASMNDWFCKLDNDGYYTMEIQNAALASAISIARELVKYESKTDRKIRLLKQRVKELEDKIEKLENN